jgi:hypothetical protein
MNTFNKLGYFKEYYYNGKFIGCITNVEMDREKIGFYGKKKELLEFDIVINKIKLKKGFIVETMIYPLCGKNIKN